VGKIDPSPLGRGGVFSKESSQFPSSEPWPPRQRRIVGLCLERVWSNAILVDNAKKEKKRKSRFLAWQDDVGLVREASACFVLSACGGGLEAEPIRWGFLHPLRAKLVSSLTRSRKLGVFALKLVDFGVKFSRQSGSWADSLWIARGSGKESLKHSCASV